VDVFLCRCTASNFIEFLPVAALYGVSETSKKGRMGGSLPS